MTLNFLKLLTYYTKFSINSCYLAKKNKERINSFKHIAQDTNLSLSESTGKAMGMTDFFNPLDLDRPVHEVSVKNCNYLSRLSI